MSRAVLLDCLPWLATLLAAVVLLRVLVWVGGRPEPLAWRRLLQLHRDETGAVQSLSFVLTVPFFIMLMMLIVQASQLMIGTVVVHYAAYASARAAVVWIPANLAGTDEPANCISRYDLVRTHPHGAFYRIAPSGPKYEKIRQAAVLACAPIAPSRSVTLSGGANRTTLSAETLTAYVQTVASSMQSNTRVPRRIADKLRYSDSATHVELTFFHSVYEPPMWMFDLQEFRHNELGWQDQISATVTHEFALLPGPARMLARRADSADKYDRTSRAISQRGSVFMFPLTATATLGNEGEKSVRPYVHSFYN